MRRILLALAAVLLAAAPAVAKQGAPDARFRVHLKVVRKPCVFAVPATVTLGASGVARLRVASLLSDCELDGVPPTLTVRIDPADKRTNVATINF